MVSAPAERCSGTASGLPISRRGLHWEALDEDISIAGLLAGYADQTRRLPTAAE